MIVSSSTYCGGMAVSNKSFSEAGITGTAYVNLDPVPKVKFSIDSASVLDSVSMFTLTLTISFANDSNTNKSFVVTITVSTCEDGFLTEPNLSGVIVDARLLRISGNAYSLPSFFTSDVLDGTTEYPEAQCGVPELTITGTGSDISTATAVASGLITMNTIDFQVDSTSADAAA